MIVMIESYISVFVRLLVVFFVIGVEFKLLNDHSKFIKEIGREIVDEVAGGENEHKSKAIGFLLCIFGMFFAMFSVLTIQAIIMIINIILSEQNSIGSTALFFFAGFGVVSSIVLASRHVENTSDAVMEKQERIVQEPSPQTE